MATLLPPLSDGDKDKFPLVQSRPRDRRYWDSKDGGEQIQGSTVQRYRIEYTGKYCAEIRDKINMEVLCRDT